MTKPSETYEFATQTNPPAVSDPASRRASGFVAGQRLPAKWLNFLLNGAGKWHAYLANLHSEPEFLNKEYTWTAWHRFHGGFTMKNGLGLAGAANEVFYTDDNGALTPRARTVAVPLTMFTTTYDNDALRPAWVYGTSVGNAPPYRHGWYSKLGELDLAGTVHVPHGATITSVEADVGVQVLGVGGTCAMRVEATAGGVHTTFAAAFRSDDGLLRTAAEWPGASVDGATQVLLIRFHTYRAVSAVHAVRLTFLDPGPRNY